MHEAAAVDATWCLTGDLVGAAADHAVDQDGLGDIQADDHVGDDPGGREGVRLGPGPRESVQQPPLLLAVGLGQPRLDHVCGGRGALEEEEDGRPTGRSQGSPIMMLSGTSLPSSM